jgi:hypothetical protein
VADRVDWNAELVRGDLGKAVQQLKRESGKGLFVASVKLPMALTELGPWADVVRGAIKVYRLEAREFAGVRLGGRWRCGMSEKVAFPGRARRVAIV